MSGIRRKGDVDLQIAWSTAFAPAADERCCHENAAGFAQVTPLTSPFRRIPLIPAHRSPVRGGRPCPPTLNSQLSAASPGFSRSPARARRPQRWRTRRPQTTAPGSTRPAQRHRQLSRRSRGRGCDGVASADLIITRPVKTARGVDAAVVLQRWRTVPGHHCPVTFRVASVGWGQRGQTLIGAVPRHAGTVSHSADRRRWPASPRVDGCRLLRLWIFHVMGGGVPSALAASPGSHAHSAQAWRNTERANSSAVPRGSGLATT
jgi:hypothetical protein